MSGAAGLQVTFRAKGQRWWLVALIVATVTVRALATIIMPQPLESDAQSYFEMARTFAAGSAMRDMYGSAAFYSPGYPMLVGAAFTVAGPSVAAALGVNLCLSAISAWLAFRFARAVSGDTVVPYLSVAAYAVWIPGIFAAVSLAKENLSVPLLLGFLLSVLAIARGQRSCFASVTAGLCFGAGLLAGASSLLIVTGFLLALWTCFRRDGLRTASVGAVTFTLAAALFVGPWLLHTTQLFGRPVLTTNSGFNLYIGNNPAATGGFVSITDTPVGSKWHNMRNSLGEAGSADALRQMTWEYASANPTRTVELAVVKLGRFWMPNLPIAEGSMSNAMTMGRWMEVFQYVVLLAFGAMGAWALRRQPEFGVIGLIVGCFWALHAAAVVMPRYRDPIMPIVIVFAAVGVVMLARRKAIQ